MQIKRRVRVPLWTLAALALVLLSTESYRLAVYAGASISVTVATLLIFLALFVLANINTSARVLSRPKIQAIIVVLLLWPAATAVYSDGEFVAAEFTALAARTLVFLAAVILFLRLEEKKGRSVMLTCLFVSAAGAILSLLAPQIFDPLREAAGAHFLYDERAFGFHLQPNALAINALFTGLAVFASTGIGVGFMITGAIIAASASRFSLLLFLISAVLRSGMNPARLARTAMVLLFLWALAAVIFNVFDLARFASDGNIFDRLGAILGGSFLHSADVGQLNSMMARLSAQMVYVDLIMQHPILGHGIGTEATMLRLGEIDLPAHSTFLKQALDYGLPYSVILLLVIAWPRNKDYAVFGVIFALSFVAYHGLYENFTGPMVFGFFLARAMTVATTRRRRGAIDAVAPPTQPDLPLPTTFPERQQ